ncbi:MAG: bifunctional 5,10-methylene-tetrahydrofolate dehydrogenase/5,10-methylene-tetrahydrofolate cyclohydrolase [Clostridiales Family XIII bacterium]|nr:bifunctional 5,10-methylene-tetrahydrofolate dehydrogenase/5,10-methylene-tetrahydrofolate cyclohydrolase [Clostridiales Family XIII bacterium]
MALLLKGKEVSDVLSAYVSRDVFELGKKGVVPGLAVVRVGESPDDLAYERSIVKKCELLKIKAYLYPLPNDVKEERLLTLIENLNLNGAIHGILMLRPLPSHLNEAVICESLSPLKDVDGITSLSMAGVYAGRRIGFPPCTARACIEILRHYGIRTAGKNAVVVGRSLVIGRPLAMMLMDGDATVTLCHSKTACLQEIVKQADIVAVALGKKGIIGKECLREGQTVIDVGINVDDDGKISGDVDFDAAGDIVAAITPSPGGVGAVTTALIARHVTDAALEIDGGRHAAWI